MSATDAAAAPGGGGTASGAAFAPPAGSRPAASATASPTARGRGPGSWLTREVAPREWDTLLRASGLVALLGIVLAALVPVRQVSDLATFFSLSLFINGPYSPLTPIGFEPILMAYGKLYAPLLVAVVGLVAQLLVEYVNYRLYGAALRTELLRRARESSLTQRVLRWYRSAPFFTTVVVALTPLPYWTVRITAPLSDYPVRRHLSATAVGRLPRLWFYAALGTVLPLSGGLILGVGLGAAALWAAVTLARRGRAALRA